jgi:hypothetical protein
MTAGLPEYQNFYDQALTNIHSKTAIPEVLETIKIRSITNYSY